MSIHTMPSRAKSEISYGSSAYGKYHYLRSQGFPAQEAWRQVQAQFPETSIQPERTAVHPSPSQSKAVTKPVQVYQDDWATLWEQVELGPVILVTIWWLVQQLFWIALWMIGFTARVLVGLLWFTLGFVVGFRVFSSR
ncbi:hypothetical protein [Microvirga thermotolerans]|uniref:Uncharacterized protein n=1 Tax=Microvirga thermotolerans TaxID=2651334 RepID=A0A5P9JSS7_9HYPH|nr:hypothetical protein [Microvirga thermotolerans]QFU15151.1 hypothetical protein GDR74_02380 [Microvirga thermotolerans]